MLRRGIVAFVTGALVVCAVGLTAANIRGAYRRANRPPTVPVATVPDWRSYAAAGHRLGPAAAQATVVVFNDYECAACRNTARRLKQILAAHPTSVAVVIRHFPLDDHAFAAAAARAAVCASEQGRFGAMHDVLLAEAESFGLESWTWYAREAGVADTTAFAHCLQDPRSNALVAADVDAAGRLGVSETPTWLLDDDLFVGDVPDLTRLIERRLEPPTDDE